MYLFTRSGRIATGNTRKALEWALGITEQVNTITGLGVSLYTTMFSPEVGTLAWSAFVDDLGTLEAANDKLQADDAFVANVDKGAAVGMGGADDSLLQVLHGAPDPNRSAEYVVAVQSVCANGNFTRGVEVGVEIAQMVERITGSPSLFVLGATGTYGGVGWLTGFPDIAALEAGNQALAADADFAAYIDREASTAYVSDPGATQQRVFRHVA